MKKIKLSRIFLIYFVILLILFCFRIYKIVTDKVILTEYSTLYDYIITNREDKVIKIGILSTGMETDKLNNERIKLDLNFNRTRAAHDTELLNFMLQTTNDSVEFYPIVASENFLNDIDLLVSYDVDIIMLAWHFDKKDYPITEEEITVINNRLRQKNIFLVVSASQVKVSTTRLFPQCIPNALCINCVDGYGNFYSNSDYDNIFISIPIPCGSTSQASAYFTSILANLMQITDINYDNIVEKVSLFSQKDVDKKYGGNGIIGYYNILK